MRVVVSGVVLAHRLLVGTCYILPFMLFTLGKSFNTKKTLTYLEFRNCSTALLTKLSLVSWVHFLAFFHVPSSLSLSPPFSTSLLLSQPIFLVQITLFTHFLLSISTHSFEFPLHSLLQVEWKVHSSHCLPPLFSHGIHSPLPFIHALCLSIFFLQSIFFSFITIILHLPVSMSSCHLRSPTTFLTCSHPLHSPTTLPTLTHHLHSPTTLPTCTHDHSPTTHTLITSSLPVPTCTRHKWWECLTLDYLSF